MRFEHVLTGLVSAFLAAVMPMNGHAQAPHAPPAEQEVTEAWTIPSAKEKFHVFILMGQSNMAGYGQVLPDDKKAIPQVVQLPTAGDIKWGPAAQPLQSSDRFSLGLPFAQEYLKLNPGVVVGLIPVAKGGFGIDQLKKGSATYTDALKKARFAATQGTLKGILWHHGESDTVTPALAESYAGKLHQLIVDLRHDLENDQLPFIAGNLAEFYGTGSEHNAPDRVKRIDRVRAVLRALPQQVPLTGFVETTGCASEDGHMVHFDRKSYIILGTRYFEVFNALTNRARMAPLDNAHSKGGISGTKTGRDCW